MCYGHRVCSNQRCPFIVFLQGKRALLYLCRKLPSISKITPSNSGNSSSCSSSSSSGASGSGSDSTSNCGSSSKILTWTGKYKLGAIAGARVGK